MEADYIAESIEEAFGARCPEFEPGCHCCRAWAQYDDLRNDALEEAAKVAEWAHMVPPDGGSPTEDERRVADAAAAAIRALKKD